MDPSTVSAAFDGESIDRTLELGLTVLVSAAIGLLVGLERERNPATKAGLRTFALIAVLGTLAALLAAPTNSDWVVVIAMVAVGTAIAAAYLVDSRGTADDSGLTTVVAAMVVFCLGAINVHGYRTLAVAIGVAMTALLHFKTELQGVARRLTPEDIRSMLQFAAVTAVVLPLLPDRTFGPYDALNPFHIWLMVVLISGVSLAGYVAWRLTRDTRGVVITGLLGGLVSSTATSLIYARHARRGEVAPDDSLLVIVLANCAMLVRVLLLATVLAPSVAGFVAFAIVPALAIAAWPLVVRLRRPRPPSDPQRHELRNPASLPAALLFAAGYAVLLVLSAWFADTAGKAGVYALALVSGSTDVDAITLSSLRLHGVGSLDTATAGTAILLGVAANLTMKATLVGTIGGPPLRPAGPRALLLPVAAIAAAWAAMRALS